LKFCRFCNLSILKSLRAGFQSALYALFISFNRIQLLPVKIRQLQPRRRQLILLIVLLTPLAFSLWPFASAAQAAAVTLAWDANSDLDVAGYRMWYGTTSHNYTSMISVGNKTTCTITNLEPGQTYYFAATAYDHNGNESAFSQEISYTVPFLDSDGDGMPDDWENYFGLDPFVNDAGDDPDGDGFSNIAEYQAGTEPTTYHNNANPEPPVLYLPFNDELVDVAPQLVTDDFYDPDFGDVHAKSQWQIEREEDGEIVFDQTSSTALTSIVIPKLVLEEDKTYIWKVRFIETTGPSLSGLKQVCF
jgi:hypothetical protein